MYIPTNVEPSILLVIAGDFTPTKKFVFPIRGAQILYNLNVGVRVHVSISTDSSDIPYLKKYERFSGLLPNMVITNVNNSLVEFTPIDTSGGCPICGEIGRFINLAPVCSKHGVY